MKTYKETNIGPSFMDCDLFPLVTDPLSFCKGSPKKGLFVASLGEEDPADRAFLQKILQAVGFDLDTEVLLYWETSPQPFQFSEVKHQTGVTQAVFFGMPPKSACLNFSAKPYEPLTLGTTTYLFADSLAKIQETPALKRPLWEALKSMWNK